MILATRRRLLPVVERGYPVLRAIERRWVPELQRRVLRTFAAWRRLPLSAQIRERLTHGDANGAADAMPWATLSAQLTDTLKPVLLLIVGAGARELGPEAQRLRKQDEILTALGADFSLINPRAVEYALARSAELVTGITQETREVIRVLVARAQQGHWTVDQLARQIRQDIGLNARQVTALENLRNGLLESGASESRIEELVTRQASRALNYRAEMIARTETISAASEGQRALWAEAKDNGLLDEEATWQVWIASPDACAVCLEIADGEPVLLGASFDGPNGPIPGPPAHPSCRCALGLQFEPPEAKR